MQAQQVLDDRQQVVLGERAHAGRLADAELLVDLVPADLGQVVALVLEEQVVQQGLRALLRRRLARAQLAVDVQQGLVLAGDVVLLQGRQQHRRPGEVLPDPLGVPAQRLEQHGDRLTALAVDAHADGVPLVHVELEPGPAGRDHLAAEHVLAGGLVQRLVEVDARRADQLGHHDPLGAVDDERALAGHHGEVAHEDGLRLDLAGLAVHELGGDEQRRRVGHVLVPALLLVRLDLVEPRVGEGQRQVAGEILDRGDLLEDLVESAGGGLVLAGTPVGPADEPGERIGLQSEEVRYFQWFAELGEGDPVRAACGGPGHAGDCQDSSFRGQTLCGHSLIARSRPFAERPEPRGVLVVVLVVDGQDIAVPLGISPGQTVFHARLLGHGAVRLDPGQHKEGSANK